MSEYGGVPTASEGLAQDQDRTISFEDTRAMLDDWDRGLFAIAFESAIDGKSATDAERSFVEHLNTQGALLIASLLQSGHQLPNLPDLKKGLSIFKDWAKSLYDPNTMGGAGYDNVNPQTVAEMMGNHALHLSINGNQLFQDNRRAVEMTGLEIIHILNGFAEANGGIPLDDERTGFVHDIELCRQDAMQFGDLSIIIPSV